MQLTDLFHPGMTNEETFVVEERQLAPHVGSGALRVLATPWLIALMEGVSHRLLAKHLPEGYSSVGTHVDMRHLAPTPLGDTVRVQIGGALRGWLDGGLCRARLGYEGIDRRMQARALRDRCGAVFEAGGGEECEKLGGCRQQNTAWRPPTPNFSNSIISQPTPAGNAVC